MKMSFRQMRMFVAALSVAGVSALSVIGWSESAAQQGAQPPFLPLSISINALMVTVVDDIAHSIWEAGNKGAALAAQGKPTEAG
jgi:hypothetical protein